MEIKVYRWNESKIDIFGLIEFASVSKLNMIKAFDTVLRLGKKYPVAQNYIKKNTGHSY